MSISEWFTDESIVNQLRSFFEEDEQWTIDFQSLLSQVEDLGDYFELKIKDHVFRFDSIEGVVKEVES